MMKKKKKVQKAEVQVAGAQAAEEDIKNRKNIKKILIFLSLIGTIITGYQIANIYAVFYSEASGILTHSIAKWNIVINDIDIVEETVQEFEVEFNIDGDSTANGKFTPGMEGSFEIIIEPRTTQVSIRYDITIDDTDIVNTDINLVEVIETEVNNTIIRTGINTYTAIILLEDIESDDDYFENIKIVFRWDEEEENGDIEVDDNYRLAVEIPISVKATQYLGETITPY